MPIIQYGICLASFVLYFYPMFVREGFSVNVGRHVQTGANPLGQTAVWLKGPFPGERPNKRRAHVTVDLLKRSRLFSSVGLRFGRWRKKFPRLLS